MGFVMVFQEFIQDKSVLASTRKC